MVSETLFVLPCVMIDFDRIDDHDYKDDKEDEGCQGTHRRRDASFLDFCLDQGGKGFDLAFFAEKSVSSCEGSDDEVV